MIILQLSDFIKGKYNIPDASSTVSSANVTEAISSYEKQGIYDLLGVALGNDVIAYLAASRIPTDANLDFIIDAFVYQDTTLFLVNYGCNSILQSAGMKEFLKGYVFYQYNKNQLKATGAGAANLKAEASNVTTPAEAMRFAENKFNDVLPTIEAIQRYCWLKSSIYTTFAGIEIPVKASYFFF